MRFQTKHGHAARSSPEYLVWQGMLARCRNPRAPNFPMYGGRGIRVCERWATFDNFLADMGPRPDHTTLDRVDGAKGYEPGNCRWATPKEQAENRSSTRHITIDGVTKSITDWARASGVTDTCIRHRLKVGLTGTDLLRPPRHGQALTTDTKDRQRRRRAVSTTKRSGQIGLFGTAPAEEG